MSLLDLFAVLLVLLVPVNVAVSGYLSVLSARHPDLPTLHSRALTQVVLTAVSAIFGYLGLVDLLGLHLTGTEFTALLVIIGILVSVPGINWFWAYWTGRLA